MRQKITIDKMKIGKGQPPFIIAEMSGNHNQSLDRALEIVEAAADSGCHAVKIQTYTADTMTIDSKRDEFMIKDEDSLWKGENLYSLYQKAHTPWDWHKPIMDKAKECGLICFSTPFDSTSVDFLESLNVPAYKIASFENNDIPLLKKVAATGKPVIMSTGMASLEEIQEAVRALSENGCKDIALLKCTSSYPASPKESNISTITDMMKQFGTVVGLSDHTLGIGVALASISFRASIIEKHFTLSRGDGGVDAAFSLEPSEMKALTEESLKAWEALGNVHYGPTESEKKSLQFRRSIFVVENVKAGEAFTDKNLRTIRPGHGLAPRFMDEVEGSKAAKDIAKGTPLSWELIIKEEM